jgi:hypothetical protein
MNYLTNVVVLFHTNIAQFTPVMVLFNTAYPFLRKTITGSSQLSGKTRPLLNDNGQLPVNRL